MSEFSLSEFSPSDGDPLDAGLAAGFGGQRVTALHAIERAAGVAVTRISLRDSSPSRAPGATEAASTEVAGRANYRVEGELARGGMGVLLRGRDVDLGREVALKVLREDLASRPEIVQRFVEEAQIGGQLQHPGIVPVYELGLMADQRPFFAMKLVRGRTLADALQGVDRRGRRKLLDVFASVCQTIAYAHSRGVVHRDLKPGNVLIGGFGEVQVIDWGLAKVLGTSVDELRARTELVATSRSSGAGAPSQFGAVMGTPAYMAPEQARGETEKIDERTDVFALGATLCEILTGNPPYVGDAERTTVQAARAELDDARQRLEQCDADRELVELCRDCLTPQPELRPRSAEVVAQRMSAYLAALAERARDAELEAARSRERAKASVRMTVAGALLVVVGSSAWFVRREAHAAEIGGLQRNVLADLGEAGEARAAGDFGRALAAAERARARTEGREELEQLGRDASAALEAVRTQERAAREAAELERSNRSLLTAVEEVRRPEGDDVYPNDWALLDRAYEQAFESNGLPLDQPGRTPSLEALASRGLTVELAGVLDEWSNVRRNAQREEQADALAQLASALDSDPLRQRLRQALATKDVDALREIAARSAEALVSAPTLWLLGHALAQAGELERAIETLERARLRHPRDFKLALELARTLHIARERKSEESLAHYQAALALRPDLVAVWHDFGQALVEGGRTERALELFRRAAELAPDDLHVAQHVANTLSRLGRYEEAAQVFEGLVERDPNSALLRVELGLALSAFGERDRALTHLERAVELDPRLPEAQLHLGVARVGNGRHADALEHVERALELAPEYADAHFYRGYCLAQLGRSDEAVEAYERSLELKSRRADVRLYMALALQNAGRFEDSRDVLEEGLRTQPDDVRMLATLSSLLTLQADEQLGGPLRALPSVRRLVEVHPNFDLGHVMLAVGLLASGDPQGARGELARARELGEETPLRTWLVGVCALRMGEVDEAAATFESLRQQFDMLSRSYPPLRAWIEESLALIE